MEYPNKYKYIILNITNKYESYPDTINIYL